MGDAFDWSKLDADEQVQRTLRDVAVYFNAAGDVVVRQRADWPHEQEDTVIVLGLEAADRMAKRLRELVAQRYEGLLRR